MSSSICKASVYKTYQDVIGDVISNVREHFIEDGVDETVLQELKNIWETKLAATKAVDKNREVDKLLSSLGHGPAEWRRVPIQINIPSPPGSTEGHRILSIDVPEVFLQGHYLKSILTGQAISTTMGLPLPTACAFLQEHVNSAFIEHQQTYFSSLSNGNDSDPVLNSSFPNNLEDPLLQNRLGGIQQCDGPADSSEEDDKSDEGSEDIDDDKEEDEEEIENDLAEEAEEEPLNSGDDVSDADGIEESFETENVIVCQYDKITRSRNRWKFHLKDGIMNLNGEDFIFQKANGDAEW